jgi:hypothetical protein
MVPSVSTPTNKVKELAETVTRVLLGKFLQQADHWLILFGVRLVGINRPA